MVALKMGTFYRFPWIPKMGGSTRSSGFTTEQMQKVPGCLGYFGDYSYIANLGRAYFINHDIRIPSLNQPG